MAVYEVKKVGDPILREKAKPVELIDDSIRQLLDDMADTMYKFDGVGLAAPQIGESLRLFVVDVGDGLIQLVNPELISGEGSETEDEGCLSIPEFFGHVPRYSKVEFKAFNRHGKEVRIIATGFKARALQHEYDHLDGILFVDKMVLK